MPMQLGIKKLDIFIVKQFGLLFVGTFFICQFVLMMQFLWRYVDELIGKGLSVEVLVQFFWYMGLMLVPQALPLAILLSSLITFGNLGESSELTAIKAAGISLIQSFRSLIVVVVIISCCSYYFQDVIGPDANLKFRRLLLSMKQKSPELEIPEGIFYDGIPGSNIYVHEKNIDTGWLYGIMIYRMNRGYEDAAIILADSGTMHTTAEKKHLLLTLYSGEWFENMQSSDMGTSAAIPYRRETFAVKEMLLDFDGDFNMTDAAGLANDARSKSMGQIRHDIDSIALFNDSVGHSYYHQARRNLFTVRHLTTADSLKGVEAVAAGDIIIDSVYANVSAEKKLSTMKNALSSARRLAGDVGNKGDYTKRLNRNLRNHQMEAIGKITLCLSCIIFFFIGAPLGAIIRKGGLGVPVIISVLVYIIYYIFDNSGMRMARDAAWTIWFGKLISTAVLAPMAVFFTYKANNDSVVFNFDLYVIFFRRLLGLRMKRNITRKEVIINDPDYTADAEALRQITVDIEEYVRTHNLLGLPNAIKVFFNEETDTTIIEINERMEAVIEDLSNTKDKVILNELNNYPLISPDAHTRPFHRRWLNIITGVLIPIGIFVYLRMWRYRLRLYGDTVKIRNTNENILKQLEAWAI